ncbi:MAG TPA: aldehyde dehydrogenase family protein [Sphingobium sp.]
MTDFSSDFTMTIDGKAATAAATLPVRNPATDSVFAQVPDAGQAELDLAVAAAARAFPGWAATPVEERRAALRAIAAIVTENIQPLSRLLTQEQGRPLADALGELGATSYWATATADMALPGAETDGPQGRVITRYVPLGVVGAIVPWNYPILLSMFKILPALLTGNTLVLKPSPYTPLTSLKLGELLRGVLPDGVLNVISGGDALGPLLTAHPDIAKISFTGSTATGKRVMAGAAATLKRVTLELGGNDAAIVLPDVDVDKIAEPLFWAAFRNSGQICVATKRIYIHEDIYDRLSAALADYARGVVVGDGLEQGTRLGPVQNRLQYDRVKDLIADAKANGLTFLTGGDVDESRAGYFIPVTIVDNPPDDARVVVEEAFGPVLPLLKYRDIDDAVARANATTVGLGGSVWSSDMNAAAAVAERLETGTVQINGPASPNPHHPFGGHKQSGLGAENGPDGLLAYTNPKVISIPKG